MAEETPKTAIKTFSLIMNGLALQNINLAVSVPNCKIRKYFLLIHRFNSGQENEVSIERGKHKQVPSKQPTDNTQVSNYVVRSFSPNVSSTKFS